MPRAAGVQPCRGDDVVDAQQPVCAREQRPEAAASRAAKEGAQEGLRWCSVLGRRHIPFNEVALGISARGCDSPSSYILLWSNRVAPCSAARNATGAQGWVSRRGRPRKNLELLLLPDPVESPRGTSHTHTLGTNDKDLSSASLQLASSHRTQLNTSSRSSCRQA